jgi:hypothetical protein
MAAAVLTRPSAFLRMYLPIKTSNATVKPTFVSFKRLKPLSMIRARFTNWFGGFEKAFLLLSSHSNPDACLRQLNLTADRDPLLD